MPAQGHLRRGSAGSAWVRGVPQNAGFRRLTKDPMASSTPDRSRRELFPLVSCSPRGWWPVSSCPARGWWCALVRTDRLRPSLKPS